MPTTPGTPGTSLDPKQAEAKLAGLITELGDEPSPDDAAVASPETADAQPVPSESAPPPSESDKPAPDDERFELTVDGEPVLVDLDELKASYTYKAHNTRAAQALADERRVFETEAQAVQAERTQYQQGLAQLTAALTKLHGEPDWVKLRSELEPAEFLKQKADWEASKSDLDRIKAHEAEVAQQAHKAQAEQFQKYRRQEQDRLLAAVPEWTDPEKAKTAHAKLVSVAKQYGYSEQDILSVTDHRAILVLLDAMKYRELHREPNAAAKAKTAGIKTAKPGTPDRPRPNEQYQKKVDRAAKSGRQRDAMDAIADLIPD